MLSSISIAGNKKLPSSGVTTAIQVFTPSVTLPIVTIAGAGNVTVSSYSVIMFQDDETIYYGADTTHTYALPANTPLGIGSGVTTIHVSAATAMLVLK